MKGTNKFKIVILFTFVIAILLCIIYFVNKKNNINENKEKGYVGTLAIPELTIEIPLYYADVYGDAKTTQKVVDNQNSAAYMEVNDKIIVIADHVEQAFKNL